MDGKLKIISKRAEMWKRAFSSEKIFPNFVDQICSEGPLNKQHSHHLLNSL